MVGVLLGLLCWKMDPRKLVKVSTVLTIPPHLKNLPSGMAWVVFLSYLTASEQAW